LRESGTESSAVPAGKPCLPDVCSLLEGNKVEVSRIPSGIF